MALSSNRPYLIRALYQWLIDNGLTPHLLVDANGSDVVVPTQFVEEGRIVLNIGLTAVRGLQLDNEMISFNARFSGQPMDVFVPPASVLGIYARENGHGMLFPEDEREDDTTPPDDDPTPPDRPALKLVK